MELWVIVGIFAAIALSAGYIIYLTVSGKRKDAEDFYRKVKYLAVEVVTYVEQIASKDPAMTNEQKKELATNKLNDALKELYGWSIAPAIVDLAIEAAVKLYNLSRDAMNKK
jgi:hypothetical protein